MKSAIALLTGTMLVASSVSAVEVSERCQKMAELADLVMELRQSPADANLHEFAGSDDGLQWLVRMAYREPIHATPKAKKSARNRMASEVLAACVLSELEKQ